MKELQNRVVMLTGASAGIGRAVAHALGLAGARVGLAARSVPALEEVVREVEDRGGQAVALPIDVSNADMVEQAADRLTSAFGPIEVWINNAMVSVFSPASEMTADEYRRVTEVTYLGYVHGTLAALRRMRPRNDGVIIQVGSALAYRGIPLQSAYCGAKHAIQGFSESVRCELMHEHSAVRISQVNLAAFNTPQFRWVKSRLPGKPRPVPPIHQPEMAADAILWTIRHPRREVNVGFPAALAIVGNNFFPGIGDRFLSLTGFDSQQTGEPDSPNRPNNLWEPTPNGHSTRGDFDDVSVDSSRQLWFTMHRPIVAAACALALGGLAALAARHR